MRQVLDKGWQYGMIRKVTSGNCTKANGKPYSQQQVDWVWDTLAELNANQLLSTLSGHEDMSSAVLIAISKNASYGVFLSHLSSKVSLYSSFVEESYCNALRFHFPLERVPSLLKLISVDL